jgi:cell division protein FtsB
VARSRRSRLLLLGAAALAAAILGAWFPASALVHQRATLAADAAQLNQLHHEDTALTQEAKNLSSSAEIARIARQQYQLVTPGQQAYEVLPPSGSSTGTPYAGDPGSAQPVAPSAASVLPAGGVTATTQPTAKAASHAHPSGATSEGTFERMLHALEFWR